MSDKRLEAALDRCQLYAAFLGRVDAIASNIEAAAHNGDTANVLVDVERIHSLSHQLRMDLDSSYIRVLTAEVQS